MTEPHRNAIVPPDPETWCSEPEHGTSRDDGYTRAMNDPRPPPTPPPPRVPDFDAMTEQAIRSAG